MAQNMLKLNDDKTQLMTFGSKRQLTNLHDITLRVGDMNIAPSVQVRNLGVQYDSSLTMEKHVNAVCRVARMHLRNISRIRAYLTIDATRSLVNPTVTSRLDYANSLLVELPQSLIDRLQKVQGSSLRHQPDNTSLLSCRNCTGYLSKAEYTTKFCFIHIVV